MNSNDINNNNNNDNIVRPISLLRPSPVKVSQVAELDNNSCQARVLVLLRHPPTYIYIYIYTYRHIYTYIYIYMYTYIYREREIDR